jgi:signal transduction histidine kinase
VDWLDIHVTDSGNGVPIEAQAKIFQPFFTTKEIGKGTGLGLSISSGIIQSHNGELKIDNLCPNTCFVIRLPKKQKAKRSESAA